MKGTYWEIESSNKKTDEVMKLMLRRNAALIVLCLTFVFLAAGCSQQNGEISPTPEPTPVQTQAQGYWAVFEELYGEDEALNSEIQYLAIDRSKSKLEDKQPLTDLFEEFCSQNGLTLLLDNIEGLTEKGLIEDLYFKDGIVISFEDQKLTEEKLVTEASKWRSGLGAIGATFTVENQDGVWKITEEENYWIS